jgi:hypothetical protein
MESSLSKKPERHATRRLSDHLMLEGQTQKVHSLVDKVYSRKAVWLYFRFPLSREWSRTCWPCAELL